MDDPDAPDPASPKRTWVHWVLFDLPGDSNGVAENASADGLPKGAREGRNDSNELGWSGPCPPVGRHRYFFKLYALDAPVGLSGPNKAALERAMSGHVLERAELMGTYARGG